MTKAIAPDIIGAKTNTGAKEHPGLTTRNPPRYHHGNCINRVEPVTTRTIEFKEGYRMPGFGPGRRNAIDPQRRRDARHAHRLAAKCSLQEIEDRQFIAEETGTEYQVSLDVFDPRTQNLPEAVASSLGDIGRLPIDLAIQESEQYLKEFTRRPDVDPDGTDVEFPDGSRMSAFRAATLQNLARAWGRGNCSD